MLELEQTARNHRQTMTSKTTSPWESNRKAQAVAKEVLGVLGPSIVPDDTEASIARRAVELLAERGIRETWYYDCPAFVLLGSRSCASLSGRDYVPSDEAVGLTNLVTVDLSPVFHGAWGDCARSFCIEFGRHVAEPANPDFRRGLGFEMELHAAMREFVSAGTTFEELHRFSNDQITSAGFENLDFMGNLGHSICANFRDRVYIEAENSKRLSEAGLFTFEPHIREVGGVWGFKWE